MGRTEGRKEKKSREGERGQEKRGPEDERGAGGGMGIREAKCERGVRDVRGEGACRRQGQEVQCRDGG